MAGPVALRGYRELMQALAEADRDTRLGIRKTFREVAEPVRRQAESLATQRISRIGPRWSRMRVGQTTKVVYVAPKQRGIRVRGPHPRRRPNLAALLLERAMEPALNANEQRIAQATEQTLDRIAGDFNHQGGNPL